jgi:hypothetical protein
LNGSRDLANSLSSFFIGYLLNDMIFLSFSLFCSCCKEIVWSCDCWIRQRYLQTSLGSLWAQNSRHYCITQSHYRNFSHFNSSELLARFCYARPFWYLSHSLTHTHTRSRLLHLNQTLIFINSY